MNHKTLEPQQMITINMNLSVEDYKLYTDYVEIWEKEFDETITPEVFFMSNVVYWTVQYQTSSKEEIKQSKKDIIDLNRALKNIFGGL